MKLLWKILELVLLRKPWANGGLRQQNLSIVGVIPDIHTQSMYAAIRPMMMVSINEICIL